MVWDKDGHGGVERGRHIIIIIFTAPKPESFGMKQEGQRHWGKGIKQMDYHQSQLEGQPGPYKSEQLMSGKRRKK